MGKGGESHGQQTGSIRSSKPILMQKQAMIVAELNFFFVMHLLELIVPI